MKGRLPNPDAKARSVSQHPSFEDGKRREQENEDFHRGQAESLCPENLNESQRQVWLRIAPELSRAGRLKPLFVDVVAEYCVVKVRMDDFRELLDSKNWTYETEGRHGLQRKSLPQAAQFNEDRRRWEALISHLGLSPATELRFNDQQGDLFDNDFATV